MHQSDSVPKSPLPVPPTTTLAALVPAYNPGQSLLATLESIASQPVPCEIFVVDDGSSPAIELPTTIGKMPLHLIRVARKSGVASALNKGLREILARDFEFISRHDCGDIDHPDRLSAQLTYLHNNADVVLLGTSVDFCSENGELHFRFIAPTTTDAVAKKMAFSAGLVHPSCMFRSCAFHEVGLYNETYPYAEDYELFFRLLTRYEVHNLPQVLLQSSYDPAGLSISNRRASLISRLRLQLRYFRVTRWQSYVGAMQTVVMTLVPYGLVTQIKGLPFFSGSR